MNAPVYTAAGGAALSVLDLLAYFARHGSMRVSDLHLKVGCPPVYRIDGALQRMEGPPLTADQVRAMARALLSEPELRRLGEDLSVDSSYIDEKMQFRLNCYHDNDGWCVAIRALDPQIPSVANVGFANSVWRDIIDLKQGLVLVTGITGAGKSTTIASLIAEIARIHPCRIVTLEDPIEYRLQSKKAVISQREVGRDVPSFARGLRDCLREDPDVIFVGEMRDCESASWTLTAAETGHLVFSTLHTRDTRGTITRLLDMFPQDRQDEIASQVSLGLRCVISQKLVPRCDGKGRIVAMEILNNVPAVSNLIRTRKLEQIYTQLQTKTRDVPEERMITMERSLANLVRARKVTAQEAQRWADNPSAFLDEMQHNP